MFKFSVPTSKKTIILDYKIKFSVLYKEIISVYSVNHTKQMHSVTKM